MPFRYKLDVLAELKKAGYSSYKIRKNKIMGEATLQKMRTGDILSWHELDTVCGLLDCQPEFLIEWYRIEERQAEEESI